ncbi:MAG: V-type ATPase subunit [Bacillota bacterium]
MDEYGWASAVGKLRVLEKGFLTKSDLGQIASSGNLEAAVGALRDSAYGPFVAKSSAEAFDHALQEALQSQYESMMALAHEPWIIAAFRARHDFHNLKVYAKSNRLGMALEEEALSPVGNLTVSELGALCEDGSLEAEVGAGNTAELVGALAKVYRGTVEIAKDKDSSDALKALKMDAFIDQAYFHWYQEMLSQFGYETLNYFVSLEIDVTNLRMFLRGKRQGIPGSTMGGVFLEGGSVCQGALLEAYPGQSLDGLVRAYDGTSLRDLAERGREVLDDGSSMTAWEKECDNFFMEVVKKAKTVPMGPEPAFGYIYGREIEARNLRVILSGKQSSVPSKQISERLREPYV